MPLCLATDDLAKNREIEAIVNLSLIQDSVNVWTLVFAGMMGIVIFNCRVDKIPVSFFQLRRSISRHLCLEIWRNALVPIMNHAAP